MSSSRTRRESPWLRDLPTIDDIVKEALDELSLTCSHKLLQLPASEVITKLEKKCHEKYQKYEELIRNKFEKGEYGKIKRSIFETSLANARRARAGATLEKIFSLMLDAHEIPWEKARALGEAEFDFVIPDLKTFKENPEKAILISLKREVRERWKLTAGDACILREIYGYPNNIWFVSLFDPPLNAVEVFLKLKIKVYVPDKSYDRIYRIMKERKISVDELSNLRKLSQIFEDLKTFLRNSGIRATHKQ